MTEGNGRSAQQWLLFAWSPSGYALRVRDGDLPDVGAELDDEGRRLVVVKVATSPLPGDRRRCAYSVGT